MVGQIAEGEKIMIDRRLFASLIMVCAAAPKSALGQRVPSVAATLNGQHPADYYRKAAELFASGQKDDAVFVFYLGQLRYRTHLAARPDLPPDRDRALFASLSETVGRPINEYAFGDIPQLNRTLLAVAAFDRANPDRFTPPDKFADVHRTQHDGMEMMRQNMLANADQMRVQRRSNGLENRN
jgi:hypothetical protein